MDCRYCKSADVFHREVVYPVVSRRSLPISDEVLYGKRPRITVAGWKVLSWHRSEQCWDSIITAVLYPRKGRNNVLLDDSYSHL
jgi:hypothetical protein